MIVLSEAALNKAAFEEEEAVVNLTLAWVESTFVYMTGIMYSEYIMSTRELMRRRN